MAQEVDLRKLVVSAENGKGVVSLRIRFCYRCCAAAAATANAAANFASSCTIAAGAASADSTAYIASLFSSIVSFSKPVLQPLVVVPQ
jgi:hypothetical protein